VQTVDEFFEPAESAAILNQYAVKQSLCLDGIDETWPNEFGLNYAQMSFVLDATSRNDDTGVAEALVGVEGG
jgi:hypothetical protein